MCFQGSLGGIHGYLGGTDGTLGPMGPGPQGPPILPPSCLSIPGLARPGPARPGAGYPAAGPSAGCRLPGRPFFGLFPPKKFLKMHRDTPRIKKNPEKKYKKS